MSRPNAARLLAPARTSALTVGGIAAALLAVAWVGCGSESERPPNVILVSIDSLRADHLGCHGYRRPTTPFLDRLAAEGVRFANAVSTTSWTLPSHAAMFTGLYDSTHGLVDNGLSLSDTHLTLAELLRERGYHTAGFFGGPYLHPTFGVGQGFDVYESCMGTTPGDASGDQVRRSAMQPLAAPSHRDVTGPRTRDAVARWAAERAAEPFFLFVHLWDVHYDFIPPPEYAAMFTDPEYRGPADGRLMDNAAIARGMADADLAHVIGLYDAEIRFTDDVLRGILDDLRGRGLLDDTLVIVTADHGEEFFEHDQKGHNKTLFDEVLRVPLIAWWPGRLAAGRVVEDQVQIVDLMPTIARFAGHRGELVVQGRDLGALMAGPARPAAARDALCELLLDGRSIRALRSNERKLLQGREDGPVALIDLLRNPREKLSEVTRAGPEGTRELREAVRRSAEFGALLGRRGPDAIEVPEELRRELQALGYLGSGKPDGDK